MDEQIPVKAPTTRSQRRITRVVDGIRERGRAEEQQNLADDAKAVADRKPATPLDRSAAEYWAAPEGGYRPVPYAEMIEGNRVIPEITTAEADEIRKGKREVQAPTPPPTPEQVAANDQRYEDYRNGSLARARGIQPVKVIK